VTPPPAQQELERLLRSNARWTTALLLLFVALLITTAAVAGMEARIRLEADRLVDEGESYLAAQYPQWRDELTGEVRKAAPKIAGQMAKRIERSMPPTRQRLEAFLTRASIGFDADRAETISEFEFRAFVKTNRAELTGLFAELRKSPDQARKVAARLEAVLERSFGAEIQRSASAALAEFDWLNKKLDKLEKEDDLNEPEKVERRMVETLRALLNVGSKAAR
jgi:hypothetical protein